MKRMRRSVVFSLFLLVGAAALALAQKLAPDPSPAGEGKPFRTYLVGNSLTIGTFQDAASARLMSERGHRFVYGMDIQGGQSLASIWARPGSADASGNGFGNHRTALAGSQWNAVVLQPRSVSFQGEVGDAEGALHFVEYAAKKSPDVQSYIFQTWPYKLDPSFDFAQKFDRKYPLGKPTDEGATYSRDYSTLLVEAVRKAQPAGTKPILMIPAGEVLYELDRRMKAGQVPGFRGASELYSDTIHLNDAGYYAVRCAFYATLYREDPKGLPPAPAAGGKPTVSAELAATIQNAAWQVVSQHALAGVKRPAEPGNSDDGKAGREP